MHSTCISLSKSLLAQAIYATAARRQDEPLPESSVQRQECRGKLAGTRADETRGFLEFKLWVASEDQRSLEVTADVPEALEACTEELGRLDLAQ
jgi:hypothetical protein